MRRLLPLLAVLLVPLVFVAGIWAGGHPDALPGFLRDALVSDSQGRVFDDALDRMASDYYRPVDKNKLLDESLTAAVASLKDRFSHYFNPKDYKAFQESTTGNFEGVGMTVSEVKQGLRVQTVFKGGPAAEAGIKKGDLITAVNGKSIAGKTSEASTNLIRGPAGTAVRLSISSDGSKRDVNVKRAEVSVPQTRKKLETRDGKKLGWVYLGQFTDGAHNEVAQDVRDLLKQGAQGIVLDLRENGGGLLEEGVLVSSLFIPDGPIVSTRGRNRPSHTYNAAGQPVETKKPVVVLVDGNTASASEIVTGALQDRGRAKVVGTRTFGKGVFQEIEEISNGGALDITVGEYFTPKGRNLGPRDGKPGGIEPDVQAKDDPKTKRDEALDKALDVLAGEVQ
jgi:carboxyl-terminal processing protease